MARRFGSLVGSKWTRLAVRRFPMPWPSSHRFCCGHGLLDARFEATEGLADVSCRATRPRGQGLPDACRRLPREQYAAFAFVTRYYARA